ncbi:MAG TPA: DUF3618 domain-containing protein [Mycobacterium sp.]|jgi:hypothetical protein
MSDDMPTDSRTLRTEIQQTRASFGDTVEALAARLNVKSRARASLRGLPEHAKGKLQTITSRAATVAGKAGDRVLPTAASSPETGIRAAVPRRLPIAAGLVTAALVGLSLFLLRRRHG